MSVFDIGDSRSFFASIERRYSGYIHCRCKSTEDLLFVIMGICHLREWIAPDFNPKNGRWDPCDTDEKSFSKEIYLTDSFDTIRRLCNTSKHFELRKERQPITTVTFDSFVDDWPDFDSVASVDDGPPTSHVVDGYPVEKLIDDVLQRYRDWFSRNPK